MKVRHKFWSLQPGGHDEYTLIDEGASFYVAQHPKNGFVVALPKKDYELVPVEPTWRDVTAECVLHDGGNLYHNGVLVCAEHGYRRRKVQLRDTENFMQGVWALIVEKKEP